MDITMLIFLEDYSQIYKWVLNYGNNAQLDIREKMLDDGGQRELKRWVDEQDFNVYTRFIEPTGCWKFWFDSEEDRVLFKLRWLEWIK